MINRKITEAKKQKQTKNTLQKNAKEQMNEKTTKKFEAYCCLTYSYLGLKRK